MSTEARTEPRVTLEVYSGRPNPSWTLEGKTLDAVTGKVRELATRTGDATPPPPVLGYRGFRIEDLGPDAPDAVFVGRGTVTLIRGKKAEHARDTVDLEPELLEDAENRGFADLLRAAGAPQPRTG